MHNANKKDVRTPNEIFAASVQRDLVNGDLLMKDLLGLTDSEVSACVDVAKQTAALGSIDDAQSIFSLILASDPVNAGVWSAYTLFLEHYKPEAAQLETCKLVTEFLDTEETTPFSAHRSVAAEASALKKWSQQKSQTSRFAN